MVCLTGVKDLECLAPFNRKIPKDCQHLRVCGVSEHTTPNLIPLYHQKQLLARCSEMVTLRPYFIFSGFCKSRCAVIVVLMKHHFKQQII